MAEQKTIRLNGDYERIGALLNEMGVTKLFLVCDGAFQFLRVSDYMSTLKEFEGISVTTFSDFQPNPLYESVVEGVSRFHDSGAEAIMAVGGGSALDVAKCIKLYSNMDQTRCYLDQDIVQNDIPLIAMPTTAGTGSEATRFAVIYYQGKKQSVTHPSIIPSVVFFDPSALLTLPEYQLRSTLLDALSHAVESFWSVNSTEHSKELSKKAIQLILQNMEGYLRRDKKTLVPMLEAANYAGRAINITQTTGGHALCYKLSSLYGIAHGHAAALCVAKLWPWMIENVEKCGDKRGSEHLKKVFDDLGKAFGAESPELAPKVFQNIVNNMDFKRLEPKAGDFEELCSSVNPVRLKNNPVPLDAEAIKHLYTEILK